MISPEEFEHKLMESDAYLQLLIEQNEVSDINNHNVMYINFDLSIYEIQHEIQMIQAHSI